MPLSKRNAWILLAAAGLSLLVLVAVQRSEERGRAAEARDSGRRVDGRGPGKGRASSAAPAMTPLRYANTLEKLRNALQARDQELIQSLLDELNEPSPEHEKILWQELEKNDPSFVLTVAGILGRIGGSATLDRALAKMAELSAVVRMPGYGADGKPAPQRSMINALASNLLRAYLKRPEFASDCAAHLLELAAAPAANPGVAQILLGHLAETDDPMVIRQLTELGEATDRAALRGAVILALTWAKSPAVLPTLAEWYGRFPSQQGNIAIAVAGNLPAQTSIAFLRARALSDFEKKRNSPSLRGIVWLGTKESNFPVLEQAYLKEPHPSVRRALIEAIGTSAASGATTRVILAARTDDDPLVRSRAYVYVAQKAEPTSALALLQDFARTEREPVARGGVRYGLLALAVKRTPTAAAARRLVVEEFVNYGAGTRWLDAVVQEASRKGVFAEFKPALRAALPKIENEGLRARIRAALGGE